MVVEDDPTIAIGLSAALESFGYEVVASVRTGEDAVRVAGELEPDVILMDINLLGEMNGVEASRVIAANSPPRIIYLTAQTSDAVLAQAKRTRHYGYLAKPFDADELKNMIEASFNDLDQPMG